MHNNSYYNQGKERRVSVKVIKGNGSWTSGSIQWAVSANVGKSLTLYENLFPVMTANRGEEGSDTGHSASISYSYDTNTGIATTYISDRYRTNYISVNWYVIQYE